MELRKKLLDNFSRQPEKAVIKISLPTYYIVNNFLSLR